MDNRQYNVLKQPTRNIKIKLDLINNQNQVVDNLEGLAIDGQITLDSSSSHRRSGNISLVLIGNSQLLPKPKSKIWFDKRVGVSIGITNYSNEDVWFNLGRFAIENVSVTESQYEIFISLSLLDYMAFLDGTLGGTIIDEVKIIDKDITINTAIKKVVEGFVDFSIEKAIYNGKELTLPYRIEKLPNITAYDIIREIVDLYKGYEVYFDENGYFIFKKINDGVQDEYIWNFEENDFKLNLQTGYKFSDIKNVIAVYGNTDNYGVQVKYKMKNKGVVENIFDPIHVDPFLPLSVEYDVGDVIYSKLHQGSYVMRGKNQNKNVWELITPNIDFNFSVESIGVKSYVVDDSKIFNEEQAKLHAEYNLKMLGRFNDGVNFSCVPIYGMDINKKIKLKAEKLNVDGDYLTTRITIPLSYNGDMTIQATKIFY